MQSDRTRLVREISHATNLDFTYVERTLNEIIDKEVKLKISAATSEDIAFLTTSVEQLQKDIQSLKDEITILKYQS